MLHSRTGIYNLVKPEGLKNFTQGLILTNFSEHDTLKKF